VFRLLVGKRKRTNPWNGGDGEGGKAKKKRARTESSKGPSRTKKSKTPGKASENHRRTRNGSKESANRPGPEAGANNEAPLKFSTLDAAGTGKAVPCHFCEEKKTAPMALCQICKRTR
jgi:hypothetical protein